MDSSNQIFHLSELYLHHLLSIELSYDLERIQHPPSPVRQKKCPRFGGGLSRKTRHLVESLRSWIIGPSPLRAPLTSSTLSLSRPRPSARASPPASSSTARPGRRGSCRRYRCGSGRRDPASSSPSSSGRRPGG